MFDNEEFTFNSILDKIFDKNFALTQDMINSILNILKNILKINQNKMFKLNYINSIFSILNYELNFIDLNLKKSLNNIAISLNLLKYIHNE